MSVRVNVRVHANGNWSNFFETCRDFVDTDQFRFAFGVECINPLTQGEFDFLFGLANTGKRTFAGVSASGDDTLQFTATDEIESAVEISEDAHDSEVGIRLHRKADHVIQ